MLAIGTANSYLHFFYFDKNISTQQITIKSRKIHNGFIICVKFMNKKENRMVSSSKDCSFKIWNVVNLDILYHFNNSILYRNNINHFVKLIHSVLMILISFCFL